MAFASRLAATFDSLWLIPILIIPVAIRFVAATVSAFLGIEGVDTRGLDTAFELYSDAILLMLAVAVGAELWTGRPSLLRNPLFLVFVAVSAAATLLWIGAVQPSLRLGDAIAPWQDFLAGVAAATGLAALTSVLAGSLRPGGASRSAIDGIRAFGFGFAGALLLRSVRLLDFGFLFGWSLPSGVVWTLDFGPSLLLTVIAVAVWGTLTLRRRIDSRVGFVVGVGAPVALAVLGTAAALGLGGFIASNALAWGGSYTVFSPTTVSLAIVGFGVGTFLATTVLVGRRMPPSAARLVFGGVSIAVLTGIQTSSGLLFSYVGILTGIVFSARGVAQLRHGVRLGCGLPHDGHIEYRQTLLGRWSG